MADWTMNRRLFLKAGSAGLAVVAGTAGFAAESGAVVETSYGKLRGDHDGTIHRFRGIAYGADTGGANRFLPPRKPASWEGVRDATAFGPSSPQTNPAGTKRPPALDAAIPRDPAGVIEAEDCLRLNVWTPGVNDRARRPVMVWLHGGGYSAGSASPLYYDGANLVRGQDVVLVTVNHRLNVFGYTDLSGLLGPDYRSSGNAGMLDIVAALEWVRDNIAAFGDDPANVTIFGESGGGGKVSMLLGMPSAKGLFHKAIVQSGPGVKALEPADTRAVTEALAREAGGVEALRTLSTADLLAAYFRTIATPGRRGFAPVVDGAALPHHPFDPAASALCAHVPLMIGSNRTEATLFSLGREKFDMTEADLLAEVSRTVPEGDPATLVAAYRAAQPNATPWDLSMLIATDVMFGARTRLLADRKSAQPAPVYVYRFDWETQEFGGRLHAMHAVEIPFVFDNIENTKVIVGNAPSSHALAKQVSSAWAAFARTGKPAAAGLPSWPQYQLPGRQTMVINLESHVASDPGGDLRERIIKGAARPAL